MAGKAEIAKKLLGALFKKDAPEAVDQWKPFNKEYFMDVTQKDYAKGGAVNKPTYSPQQITELNKLFDPDRDIRDYENMKYETESMPDDIRYSTHLGPKPRRPMHLETFGTEIPIGDAPYDVAEGAESLADLAYTGARIAPYFNPWTAPVAAALDISEGIATDDPSDGWHGRGVRAGWKDREGHRHRRACRYDRIRRCRGWLHWHACQGDKQGGPSARA